MLHTIKSADESLKIKTKTAVPDMGTCSRLKEKEGANTMSKMHVSMKYIRNLWRKTFRCGYCELYYIFYNEDPVYYNSGIYGWNCDIYCDYKRDIAITTGYRNMTGQNIPSELLKNYTNNAKKIIENQGKISFDEIKKALDENREKFLDELKNI